MDGQNFENGTNEQQGTPVNNYQDNTANTYNPVPPVDNSQTPKQTNALAIVSLVLGITSIVLGCCTVWVGFICGIAGIVCAILSKKQGKSGIGTAGLVCSIIGIVLSVLMLILAALGLAIMGGMSDMGYYY